MKNNMGRPTSLVNSFLAGAALSVFVATPSTAQVSVPPTLKLYSGSYHSKTNIRDPKNLASTSTITFTGTIPESEYYKNWTELWALAAVDCQYVKAKFPKKTRAARIRFVKTTSSYELFYKLESKTATSDSFSGEIKGHNCGGYNLNLLVNTDLTISH